MNSIQFISQQVELTADGSSKTVTFSFGENLTDGQVAIQSFNFSYPDNSDNKILQAEIMVSNRNFTGNQLSVTVGANWKDDSGNYMSGSVTLLAMGLLVAS